MKATSARSRGLPDAALMGELATIMAIAAAQNNTMAAGSLRKNGKGINCPYVCYVVTPIVSYDETRST